MMRNRSITIRLSVLIICSLVSFFAAAQNEPGIHYELKLDEFASSDSVVSVPKSKLVQVQKIFTNFSWANINEIEVYRMNSFSESHFFKPGKKNTVTDELRNHLSSLSPGSQYVIAVKVTGPKNKSISWPPVMFNLTGD